MTRFQTEMAETVKVVAPAMSCQDPIMLHTVNYLKKKDGCGVPNKTIQKDHTWVNFDVITFTALNQGSVL